MKSLGPAFVVPDTHEPRATDCSNDNYDNDEEFKGFSTANLEEMQRKIEATPDKIRQWLNIDNDCPKFEHVSDAEIIDNVRRLR